jgi:hypothetical protein
VRWPRSGCSQSLWRVQTPRFCRKESPRPIQPPPWTRRLQHRRRSPRPSPPRPRRLPKTPRLRKHWLDVAPRQTCSKGRFRSPFAALLSSTSRATSSTGSPAWWSPPGQLGARRGPRCLPVIDSPCGRNARATTSLYDSRTRSTRGSRSRAGRAAARRQRGRPVSRERGHRRSLATARQSPGADRTSLTPRSTAPAGSAQARRRRRTGSGRRAGAEQVSHRPPDRSSRPGSLAG